MSGSAEADLDWQRDGRSWPLHEASRFVDTTGLHWHVQQLGTGPDVVLIHGTGSSTHSWATLAPLLAARWRVLSMDLPGHGFTRGMPAAGLSLESMGAAVTTLLHSLSIRPALLIGHSAGAAIAVRMALDGLVVPTGIVSLNGALLPFGPLQGLMFAPMAKALALLPFAPRLFAWGARDRSAVERLIASTGSKLDDRGVELYWRLVRSPAHVAGVLQMMSQWHLDRLASELPQLKVPLALLVGARDRTVLPASAERVRELLPAATLTRFPGLGHLMHEERPERIAEAIFAQAQAWHV